MFTRSPLLNECLTGPRPERNPKVDALTARISSILNTMDRPIPSSTSRGPLPAQRPLKKSEDLIVTEIQRIQEVVTDLIAVFQDYRFSIDAQLERLCVEVSTVDIKMQMHLETRLNEMKQSILTELDKRLSNGLFTRSDNIEAIKSTIADMNLPQLSSDEISKIHTELDVIRQAEIEIVEKINLISRVNAECHQASDAAMKCIRDVINQQNR